MLERYTTAIEASPRLQWQAVDEDTRWTPHSRDLLATVTERLDAHFRDRLVPLLCEVLPLIEAQV